jgi:hypothetical protein
MTDAGRRLIEGAQEALAVASGEKPAASIWHNGHRYVPASAAEPVNVKPLGDVLDDLRSKVRQELVDAAHTFRSDAVRSSTMFTAETLVSNVIGREIERYREKALTIDT